MIYVAFYLIRAALLLAIPAAWLLLLYLLARAVGKRFSRRGSINLLAVLLAVSPFLWIGYGWQRFSTECTEIRPLTKVISIDRQSSLLMRIDLGFEFGKQANIQVEPILQVVGPLCIENEFRRPITDPQTRETFRFERRCGRNYLRTNELMSNYALVLSTENDFTSLGYTLTYRIQKLKDSSVVAEAREAIFGRGILSQFIGLFSGSNNKEYLACGYIDSRPRIWRNTRVGMGHPDYESYKAIDQKLFAIVTGESYARQPLVAGDAAR
jgi:hypothetical protein